MPTAGAGLARWLGLGLRRTGGLTHGVGQREEVVTTRPVSVRIRGQPDDLPAARSDQPLGVPGTEIVGVWLGIRSQWP